MPACMPGPIRWGSSARSCCTLAGLGALLLSVTSACRNFTGPAPSLAVSPPGIEFSGAAQGQFPPAQAVSVYQIGTGGLRWTARADVPWLSLSAESGAAPALVWIEVSTVGLIPGSYSGTIAFSAARPGTGHVTVPVALEVRQVVSVTGRWVGVGATANLALTLTDSSGWVAGSGYVSPDVGHVTVAGTRRGSEVALNLAGAEGAVVTYIGSLVDDNATVGTLTGAGFSEARFALFRQ